MKPSEGNREVIEEFGGIIQSYDDAITLAGVVRHCFGVFDTVERKLVKLGGCLLLASSCSSFGSVISMAQIEYEEERKLVIHTGSYRQLISCTDLYPHASSQHDVMEFGMGR